MSSVYTLYPSSMVDNSRRDRPNEAHNGIPSENHQQPQLPPQYQQPFLQQHQLQHLPLTTPILTPSAIQNQSQSQNHLSPFSPPQALSNSASPVLNSHTPAESVSTLSVHYQSSEFSEFADDPFLGVDFDNVAGTSPNFFDDHSLLQIPGGGSQQNFTATQTGLESLNYVPEVAPGPYLPITPDQTPSLQTKSPHGGGAGGGGDQGGGFAVFPNLAPNPKSVSPRELARATVITRPLPNTLDFQRDGSGSQLTPDTSGSGRSSDDGLAPAAALGMTGQSPRVTVSLWGRDQTEEPVTYSAPPEGANVYTGISSDDIGIQYPGPSRAPLVSTGEDTGRRVRSRTVGQGMLEQDRRQAAEIPSLNQQAAERNVSDRNQEVNRWLSRANTLPTTSQPQGQGSRANPEQPRLQISGNDDDGIPLGDIALGSDTVNKPLPGQTYFEGPGGEITEDDLEIMRQNRNWADAPVLFPISDPNAARYQPETSQQAIERFEKACQDTDSIVSRAATWGTRRRSLPSIADIEGVISGNFLKKLSLSRGDTRRPSILQELRGKLVRKPSTGGFKRNRNEQEEEGSGSGEPPFGPPQRQDSLAPPSRSLSWGKKSSVPDINTAFITMGAGMASIGAGHARSGSISTSTPITSPKSPSTFSLSMKKPLNRIRSKSDLTKTSASSLADLWKKTGGPPVGALGKAGQSTAAVQGQSSGLADLDDDDDDDDDFAEDPEMKTEANKIIEDITPNFAGFQQHVLKLNPMLATSNNFLVDRIAHQQIIRYKGLSNNKIKHLQHVGTGNCPAGTMCIALGGSANVIDARGDPRGLDPLSARFDPSDGDVTPLEGAISQESFPPDIPMPPTATLPAEFECQLCYQSKKFQKPSDWTKHVHEDVQPFTCTWDRCRDPKIFKRKADWVRHENEGHRHLEWWTCDVEDCRHVCYRRDNFLQHLVREHKFPEPKVKTKAAIKRAGGVDPTWGKVEACHEETQDRPQDEPCRFCGRTFPTWKKLTVHLAKHMEQISLPILRLVARRELEADTIISPVQDPPPRPFPAAFPVGMGINPNIKREMQPFDPSPTIAQAQMARSTAGHLGFPTTPQSGHGQQQSFMFPFQQQTMFRPHFDVSPTMGGVGGAGGYGIPHQHQHQQPAHGHSFTNISPQGFTGLPPVVTTGGSFMTTSNPASAYVSVGPDSVEQFPGMQMNALGLQTPTGMVQVPVSMSMGGGLIDPSGVGVGVGGDQGLQGHYGAGPAGGGSAGTASPFVHSPHPGQGGFYQQ